MNFCQSSVVKRIITQYQNDLLKKKRPKAYWVSLCVTYMPAPPFSFLSNIGFIEYLIVYPNYKKFKINN